MPKCISTSPIYKNLSYSYLRQIVECPVPEKIHATYPFPPLVNSEGQGQSQMPKFSNKGWRVCNFFWNTNWEKTTRKLPFLQQFLS